MEAPVAVGAAQIHSLPYRNDVLFQLRGGYARRHAQASAHLRYRRPSIPRRPNSNQQAQPSLFSLLPPEDEAAMPRAYPEPCSSESLSGEMHLVYGAVGHQTAGRIITANIVILAGALQVTCTNMAGVTVLEVEVEIHTNIREAHFLFVRKLGWRAIAFFSGDGEAVLALQKLRDHSQLTLTELDLDPRCDACHDVIRGALILQEGRALHFGCGDLSKPWHSGVTSDMSGDS